MFVQVLDKEISAFVEHRKGVENAIAYFKVVGVGLCDIASIKVHGMAQLIVVHAMVGIVRQAIGGFAQGGVGVRHSVAKRVRHLGIVVFEQDRPAVFQTLGEVVLGRDRRQDGKLVASQAKCRLVHLHIQLEIEAHLQDIAVALVVSKDVVAVLKVIDVDKRHGYGQFLLPDFL